MRPGKLTQNHRFFWHQKFCNWLFLSLAEKAFSATVQNNSGEDPCSTKGYFRENRSMGLKKLSMG
jgi:hypothetical protein